MDFVKEMKAKAVEYQNNLVLPEGTEERTIAAAQEICKQKIAKTLTLLGDEQEIKAIAKKNNIDLDGITIVNPKSASNLTEFANIYYDLRKHKGMTQEQALVDMQNPLRYGSMMVKTGIADSMVAGAENTTGDVLRAGLAIIGTAAGSKTASSCFVMQMADKKWGHEGMMIFADCAVIPSPTAEQLSDIAISAAQSCKNMIGADPAVAMLSFSTKGSGGKADDVLKVQEATRLAKEKSPSLLIDGELQADAALIPSVTQKKAPNSPITGKVNTIVFPDLGAGNIGYKLVQRLANAQAFGPFLQGFAKPISDLSRGCSVEDIVTTAAVTLVQAGKK
ncbi:MAG: phosphate acetyltransferase [Treponemataceae bacterium]